MLAGAEYGVIKTNYDEISRTHFPQSYFPPDDMSLAGSDALFPPPELSVALGAEYEIQCRQLCLGPYPSWTEVQARFQELKGLL